MARRTAAAQATTCVLDPRGHGTAPAGPLIHGLDSSSGSGAQATTVPAPFQAGIANQLQVGLRPPRLGLAGARPVASDHQRRPRTGHRHVGQSLVVGLLDSRQQLR
jgi:hypothetical protein